MLRVFARTFFSSKDNNTRTSKYMVKKIYKVTKIREGIKKNMCVFCTKVGVPALDLHILDGVFSSFFL